MDLGIAGRKAIVCGASRGLGYACAAALLREGVDVLIVARGQDALAKAASALNAMGASKAQGVAADVASEEGRKLILAANDQVAMLPRFANACVARCPRIASAIPKNSAPRAHSYAANMAATSRGRTFCSTAANIAA